MMIENHEIVSYIIEKGLSEGYTFGAITNGYWIDRFVSLIQPGIIEFLQVTLDGDQYRHDTLRRHRSGAGPEIGEEVPAFSVVSMDDSAKTISNVSMKGKYYLMDFWATWCGPCVVEMPNLQKAYETFKGDGFTILSLSLDRTKEEVVKFREMKRKMPWLNVFLGADSQNRILRDFDVMTIPSPVLVDSTGKNLATSVQLRGDQMTKTLDKYLKK